MRKMNTIVTKENAKELRLQAMEEGKSWICLLPHGENGSLTMKAG